MRSSTLLFFSVACCSTALGCTVDRLPPPDAPARELPPQEEPLPTESEGLSRVVITTDTPARVERIAQITSISHPSTWRTSTGVSRELLCAETPCTVSLPYGDHDLEFQGLVDRQRVSSTRVSVRRASTVINHTLGQVRGNPVRVLGGAIVVTGLTLLAVAVAMTVDAQKHHRASPEASAPLVLTGVGSLLVGGVVIGISPTKVQDGATTQWTPAPSVAGATVTAGVRF